MAVGQTMPNLNVPIVSSFQIIKPPKSIQEQYYAFVAQIDKSKFVSIKVSEFHLQFHERFYCLYQCSCTIK
jgi:type I restriction enzyme S subunit